MNPPSSTDWLPGIIGVAVGLLGAILLLVLRKKSSPSAPMLPSQDETNLALERRANTLLEQLRELNQDRHNLGDERYQAEKARLEVEAAEAFRARDLHRQGKGAKAARGTGAATPATVPPPSGFGGRHPQLVGALWGAGVVLFFGVMAYILMNESKPRTEDQTMTGRVPPGAEGGTAPGARGPMEDPVTNSALARLKANPDDLEAIAGATHELIRAQRFDEAEQQVERGLGLDPFHAELRVHRAVLRATRGELNEARMELERLANLYPNAHEAMLFSGAIAMQLGDAPGALSAFERFTAEAPREEQPPQLGQAMGMLRQQLGAQP
jgi:tetratricopeptide (TPR) repeat protein